MLDTMLRTGLSDNLLFVLEAQTKAHVYIVKTFTFSHHKLFEANAQSLVKGVFL